jgi:hypothetical protein
MQHDVVEMKKMLCRLCVCRNSPSSPLDQDMASVASGEHTAIQHKNPEQFFLFFFTRAISTVRKLCLPQDMRHWSDVKHGCVVYQ